MELIDRQELLRQIDIDAGDEPGYYGDTWKFIDTIKNMPSATDTNVGTKLGTNLAEVGTDCISRAQAIDALRDYLIDKRCPDDGTLTCRLIENEVINKLPSIQPKHKTGRWIERESGKEDKEDGFETVIVCSCCDFPATTFYSEDCESRTQIRTDFCPNCGADMRQK